MDAPQAGSCAADSENGRGPRAHRFLIATALLVLLAAVLPAAAAGARGYEVAGGCFGHGVG